MLLDWAVELVHGVLVELVAPVVAVAEGKGVVFLVVFVKPDGVLAAG